MLTEKKKEFIEFMLSANVLRFGEFVTKSGRNTQYFVNTGLYRTGAQLSRLGKYYAGLVAETIGGEFDAMFGPAYKGIPLVSACAPALWQEHHIDKPYFFNRKEAKDHGEGGSLIGYKPKDGDRIVIVEDVVTAGTAVRESAELLGSIADLKLAALIVSIDRRERGQGSKAALDELEDEFGLKVCPIATVYDVIDKLHRREVDGRVLIDDDMKSKMEAYLAEYGAR